jgi:RNA polymerase sigma-70 factor (ECF subfamily)
MVVSTPTRGAVHEEEAPRPLGADTERPERAAAGLEACDVVSVEHPRVQDLYRDHFAFVWRTLRRLGVGPGTLDDAVQDVFVVVHRRLIDFQPGAAPRPWLFGIALRVAQQYRRSHWRQTQSLDLAEELHGADQLDPYQAALHAESADAVQRFLTALDANKRNVFILADLEQMSGQEVAQALNVNLNTVYARLRAARKQLIESVQRERARARRLEHG